MKLARKGPKGFHYELDADEAHCLRTLVSEFPLTKSPPVKISRQAADAATLERERLLNESLAQHRLELRNSAEKIVAANLKAAPDAWKLRLDHEQREILLQLMNDIRVGCWHALGQPDELDFDIQKVTPQQLHYHHLIHLAGFFECHFLNLDLPSES